MKRYTKQVLLSYIQLVNTCFALKIIFIFAKRYNIPLRSKETNEQIMGSAILGLIIGTIIGYVYTHNGK